MMRLAAIVLGAAAGGGFPQWNCRCPTCAKAWGGALGVQARTQTSLAVSADGVQWTLLNAAPDLRAQIIATSALHPQGGLRGSPIAAVVLTGGEVDQVAGLLNLRERQPFTLFATAETLGILKANPIFDVLAHDVVKRRTLAIGVPFDLPGGMQATLFAVPGKVPLYLEGSAATLAGGAESNVGVEIRASGARLAFVPGAADMTPDLKTLLGTADAVLFDGTLFHDDEMVLTCAGPKTGRRMGHMPIDGAGGSLEAFASLSNRRIYIHINNTNPVLLPDSPARRTVEAAGWEIAEDGMEIVL